MMTSWLYRREQVPQTAYNGEDYRIKRQQRDAMVWISCDEQVAIFAKCRFPK